jgi:alpha-L-fucosidase 2
MNKIYNWEFPLSRTHTGMLLGNADTGLMVWGEDNVLKITIGRADAWDHRGGLCWTESQNFAGMKAALIRNDKDAIDAMFESDNVGKVGVPERPSIIPVGRIELVFQKDVEIVSGEMNLDTAELTVNLRFGKVTRPVVIMMSMNKQIASLKIPCEIFNSDDFLIRNFPAYVTLDDKLRDISFKKPAEINVSGFGGWVQEFPNDPGVAVVYKCEKSTGLLWLATARGHSFEDMQSTGTTLIDNCINVGAEKISANIKQWWADFWKDVPAIELPNENLMFLYNYGMYKFGCATNPTGTACTLQGPWIEEYQLPPWSSDYHFNINVQMCYWPAFKGNRFQHLMPLFDMMFGWEDSLRDNAKKFVGIDDGIMLPHAVDDKGTCMGGFWTGCIDHACMAWIAQMMFDYCMYSGDVLLLKEKIFSFMKGTMRVYEEMMDFDGGVYSLPVSVSPEYRGASMNAWGKNASFQLACIHRLLRNLVAASEVMNIEPEAKWLDMMEKLPPASFVDEVNPRLALWEGTDLEESHRHHSHLGAIYPFDTIDISDKKCKEVLKNSIIHWIIKGMGFWTGWCMPWASIIHSRIDNGAAAEEILSIWQSIFTNEGHGTLHDAGYSCVSMMRASLWGKGRTEIMQLDAGFGAVTAIQEMLMHSRQGILHIFPGVPCTWKNCSFHEMPTEFGVFVSAERQNRKTVKVVLRAARDTTLKLKNPMSDSDVLNLTMKTGDVMEL